jgi:hypothetical protein
MKLHFAAGTGNVVEVRRLVAAGASWKSRMNLDGGHCTWRQARGTWRR